MNKRKLLKAFIILLLTSVSICLLFLILFITSINSNYGSKILLINIVKWYDNQVAAKIVLGSINGSFSDEIIVKNIKIVDSNNNTFIHAKQLTLKTDISKLWFLNLDIKEAILTENKVIIKNIDGSNPFEDLKIPKDEKEKEEEKLKEITSLPFKLSIHKFAALNTVVFDKSVKTVPIAQVQQAQLNGDWDGTKFESELLIKKSVLLFEKSNVSIPSFSTTAHSTSNTQILVSQKAQTSIGNAKLNWDVTIAKENIISSKYNISGLLLEYFDIGIPGTINGNGELKYHHKTTSALPDIDASFRCSDCKTNITGKTKFTLNISLDKGSFISKMNLSSSGLSLNIVAESKYLLGAIVSYKLAGIIPANVKSILGLNRLDGRVNSTGSCNTSLLNLKKLSCDMKAKIENFSIEQLKSKSVTIKTEFEYLKNKPNVKGTIDAKDLQHKGNHLKSVFIDIYSSENNGTIIIKAQDNDNQNIEFETSFNKLEKFDKFLQKLENRLFKI